MKQKHPLTNNPLPRKNSYALFATISLLFCIVTTQAFGNAREFDVKDGTGDWATAGDWKSNALPADNLTSDYASFTAARSGTSTVTINTDRQVGAVKFDASNMTFSGTGILQISSNDVGANTSGFFVTDSQVTIGTAIEFKSVRGDDYIYLNGNNSTITFNDSVTFEQATTNGNGLEISDDKNSNDTGMYITFNDSFIVNYASSQSFSKGGEQDVIINSNNTGNWTNVSAFNLNEGGLYLGNTNAADAKTAINVNFGSNAKTKNSYLEPVPET